MQRNQRNWMHFTISNLSHFPSNADHPADAVVTDQKGLHRPPPEVTERENVKVRINTLDWDVRAIDSVFLKCGKK